jgi:parallel beta-helix repeat protein
MGERGLGAMRSSFNLKVSFLIIFLSICSGNLGAAQANDSSNNIYQSGTIDSPGAYQFNQSFFVNGGGLVINAQNVTINFNGFNITCVGVNCARTRSYKGVTTNENTSLANGSLYGFPTGVYINANKSWIFNMTLKFNTDRAIYSGAFSNYTITNNQIVSNYNNGIYLQSPLEGNITNNNISGNYDSGLVISGGSRSLIQNNTFDSNYGGVMLSYTSNNSLISNSFTSNSEGVYINGATNNTFQNNTFINAMIALRFFSSQSGNLLFSNRVANSLESPSLFSTSSQKVTTGEISFNVTLRYLNTTICPLCNYNITLYPSESSFNYSRTNETITGSFYPKRVGVYSIRLNVSDEENNSETRKYVFLVNASGVDIMNYYFRNITTAHRSLPSVGTGYDVGSLDTSPPTSSVAENRTCSSEVFFSTNQLLPYLFANYDEANYRIWYNLSENLPELELFNHTGVMNYSSYRSSILVNQSNMSGETYVKSSESFTFKIDLASDYFWRGYFFGIIAHGNTPFVFSNGTDPSYANLTYTYSNTPAIKSITNEYIDVLSSTMISNSSNSSTLTLEGTGLANISILMPESGINYTVLFDEGVCNDSDCNVTSQLVGELNLSLNLTSIHTLEIFNDSIAPQISLVSPSNGLSSTNTSQVFSYNLSDTTSTNCSLIVDEEVANSISSAEIISEINNFTNSSSVGSHNWSVNCTDINGNTSNSITRVFTITVEDTSVPSSSNGGSSNFDAPQEQIEKGIEKILYRNWMVSFKIDTETHKLKVNSIQNNSANITISSDPITLTLMVGEEKKMNLSSLLYYDFYVRLNSVKSNSANFTIQTINESIAIIPTQTNETKASIVETVADVDKENLFDTRKLLAGVILVGVVVIGILIALFSRKHKKKRN